MQVLKNTIGVLLTFVVMQFVYRKERELFLSVLKLSSVFFQLIFFNLMQYKEGEQVILWVNKVGPYNNPQETYNYYSLPFCHPPGEASHKWSGLGEVLGGNELIDSQLDIKFRSMSSSNFVLSC